MYAVRTIPGAERDLERLKKQIRREDFERLRKAIRNLSEEPHPVGVIKIKGRENSYRIRVGKYRIVYEIYDRMRMVFIVEVARRNESTHDF